jgi:antitoxin component YwqK of YwqJK toxin-antitoxin module
MNLLHKNLIEYVLNPYLDYLKDIQKLRKIFQYNFNIKQHLKREIEDCLEDGNVISLLLDNNKLIEKAFYETKEKLYEVKFKDNKEYQKWWYKNGNLQHVFTLKNGEYEHLIKNYRHNGDLLFEHNYENGKKHGTCKTYMTNNRLSHEETYKNGIKHGEERTYNLRGKILEVIWWHNGVKIE